MTTERQMTTADIVYDGTEEQRVEDWRSEVLERAGYDGPSAAVLARRRDVDLHRAVELVQRGCPPSLAVKILL